MLLQTLDTDGVTIEPTPEGPEVALALLQQRTGAAPAVPAGVLAAWRAAPRQQPVRRGAAPVPDELPEPPAG